MITSAAEREDIIARNLAAVEEHFHNETPETIDKAIAVFTDDIVWEVPARGLVLRGIEDVKQEYLKIFGSMNIHKIVNLHRFATEEWVFDDSIFELTIIGDGFPNCPFPPGTTVSVRLLHVSVPGRQDLPGTRLRDLARHQRPRPRPGRYPRDGHRPGVRMTIAVIGATGTIGPHVVRSLQARDATIRVITRDAERVHAASWLDRDTRSRHHRPRLDHRCRSGEGLAAAAHLARARHDRRPATDHPCAPSQRRADREDLRDELGDQSGWSVHLPSALGGREDSRVQWSAVRCPAAQCLHADAYRADPDPGVRATGAVANALGTSGISFIDARDVGECAAVTLLCDEWDGQALVLTGPRSVTYREIADALGRVAGVPALR